MPADPKPPGRVRDPALLKALHRRWRECVLCGTTQGRLSLHHLSKHPRDDVEANLVMLCGSGTTGCHGLVEAHDPKATHALGRYVTRDRPEFQRYLAHRLGSADQAIAWMNRYLYVYV